MGKMEISNAQNGVGSHFSEHSQMLHCFMQDTHL